MEGVIILAPQTDDRKSRPKGYSSTCNRKQGKEAVDFDGGHIADCMGFNCRHKGAAREKGGEGEVCMQHLPMFTWTFFIQG